MAQAASTVLPRFPLLSALLGPTWLGARAKRAPDANVHPLLRLLQAAAQNTQWAAYIQHLEGVLGRLKSASGRSWPPRRLKQRLQLSPYHEYAEWHSVISELFLRDFLEQKGCAAKLTASGPDIRVSDGQQDVWLEVYTPARVTAEEYINNLICIGVDWQNKPVDLSWSFSNGVPTNVSRKAAKKLLTLLDQAMHAQLPFAGAYSLSPTLTIRLAISQPGTNCSYMATGSPARFGVSLPALPNWLSQELAGGGGSWSHKIGQLAQQQPSVLVLCPLRAINLLSQLGALGVTPVNVWSDWQWPPALPPQCKGILLWWYQLGTSAPWQKILLTPKATPGLPPWFVQALGVQVITI